MAPSARSSRSHAERGLARPLAQRSTVEGRDSSAPSVSSSVPATSTPSQSAPAGVSLPPHGAAALVVIVVVLSVFILGFAGWRIWVWKRHKKTPSSEFLEKSKKNGLFDPVDDDRSLKRSMSSSRTVEVALPTDVKAAVTRDRSPQDFKVNLNYEPKVVYAIPAQDSNTIVPPGITITPAPRALQISPPPHYVQVPASALSPRTSSRASGMGPITPSPKLPRLVIVESTFSTTLPDELDIREGETLRLLEEYEDEWCLVQRVGPADAEKGVIPRFCVIDKPDVPPTRKSRHIPRISSVAKI